MVARILDAAQRVLIEQGYEGASTNRIAGVAGISPGSLYQYFPNKDAVVAAVISRFSDQMAAQVADSVSAHLDHPAPTYVRVSIAALLDALDVHPEFLRAIVEHTPRLGVASKLVAFEQRISDLTMAYLTLNRRHLRSDTTHSTATWMLVRLVEHLCIRYVIDQPAIAREEFLDEITVLVLNYLRPYPSEA
ncbi:TetR/AcrR family transcriptional regulator [Mycobacterium sp. UM_WWY]